MKPKTGLASWTKRDQEGQATGLCIMEPEAFAARSKRIQRLGYTENEALELAYRIGDAYEVTTDGRWIILRDDTGRIEFRLPAKVAR